MAYIKKKSERKYKITVCNGYKVNGQKRMKAQTITVPSSCAKARHSAVCHGGGRAHREEVQVRRRRKRPDPL